MVLSADELTGMRTTATESMPDTCKILTASETADGYGQMVTTWSTGSAIACGFGWPGRMDGERRRANGTILVVAATLRLSLGTAVAVKDKVLITHRLGTAITPNLTFGVAGLPRQGPTGIVVDLEEVT